MFRGLGFRGLGSIYFLISSFPSAVARFRV